MHYEDEFKQSEHVELQGIKQVVEFEQEAQLIGHIAHYEREEL